MEEFLDGVTDEQIRDAQRAVIILVSAYTSRRAVRKCLVAFGVPDEAAKRVYSAACALAWGMGANYALAKRFSDKSAEAFNA